MESLGQMVEQGRIPSSERDVPAPRPSALLDYDGRDAYYRLVVAGSEVAGWSNALAVEGITLIPWHGPVAAQRTYIEQPPGDTVVYSKINHRYDVGHGRNLIVCVRKFALNLESIVTDVEQYRREATGVLGAIAAVFDERFAVDELAENVIVMDDQGESADKMMDVTWRTRQYSPHLELGMEGRTVLEGLEIDSTVSRAARWYLKGVQEGPTADGVIWLCTSIESLVAPLPGQRKRFNRKAIEEAVRQCGHDPQGFEPNLGRVVQLRADVVHHGKESTSLLKGGYYVLEQIARILIRNALDVTTGWPLDPNFSASQTASRIRSLANTEWVNQPER